MPNPPGNPNPEHALPDDLLAIAGALDRLAAAERAALSPEAMARLGDLPHLLHVEQDLERDAAERRGAVPHGLEPRVFARSRAALSDRASLPFTPAATEGGGPSVWVRWGRTARLAAAMAMVAGGVMAIRALRPAPVSLPGPAGTGAVEPIAVVPTGTPAGSADAVDTVFALLASIDTTARTRELEDLVSEADGLMASIREPARAVLFNDSPNPFDRQ
jgi:hypothetical protein